MASSTVSSMGKNSTYSGSTYRSYVHKYAKVVKEWVGEDGETYTQFKCGFCPFQPKAQPKKNTSNISSHLQNMHFDKLELKDRKTKRCGATAATSPCPPRSRTAEDVEPDDSESLNTVVDPLTVMGDTDDPSAHGTLGSREVTDDVETHHSLKQQDLLQQAMETAGISVVEQEPEVLEFSPLSSSTPHAGTLAEQVACGAETPGCGNLAKRSLFGPQSVESVDSGFHSQAMKSAVASPMTPVQAEVDVNTDDSLLNDCMGQQMERTVSPNVPQLSLSSSPRPSGDMIHPPWNRLHKSPPEPSRSYQSTFTAGLPSLQKAEKRSRSCSRKPAQDVQMKRKRKYAGDGGGNLPHASRAPPHMSSQSQLPYSTFTQDGNGQHGFASVRCSLVDEQQLRSTDRHVPGELYYRPDGTYALVVRSPDTTPQQVLPSTPPVPPDLTGHAFTSPSPD